MTTLPFLALLLQVEAAAPPPPPADTVSLLRRAARRAEAAFERTLRQRAPVTFASFGRDCDEIVGRFCLTYDSQHLPAPPPEPAPIIGSRREAIEALRRAFAYAPDELDVTGPLVRYLVEDERAQEAVAAARAFMMLSSDTTWGALLLGFALHAAGEDTVAARLLEDGVSRLDVRDRDNVEDVSWLLSYDEQRRYRRLDDSARIAYNRAVWRLADPLYLTPGNERRNEHLARHVWSRILSRAPVVAGMVRWGRDLEQLTVRYGTPRSRMRGIGGRPGETSMIERFDPDQLAYMPEDMLGRGVPPPPLPGETWPLDNPRARSGYAPGSIRRIVALDHQVSRFPVADGAVVRVDAKLPLDSVAATASRLRAGLFLLDSLYAPVHGAERWVDVAGDTAWISMQATARPGRFVYSAEAFEPDSRFAARARYALEATAARGLTLSDLVVAEPFGGDSLPGSHSDERLRPLGSLIVAGGTTLGVFAEVSGLSTAGDGRTRYRVEVTRLRGDRSSLPAEVVAWIGRRLGVGGRDAQPRVAWTAQGDPAAPAAIALDLGLEGTPPGLYVLQIAVTDLVTSERQETRRAVRVR